MPKCKVYITGCTAEAVKGSAYCNKCRLKQQTDDQLRRAQAQREKEDKEREAVMLQLSEKAKKTQEATEKKKQKITEVASAWNQQINKLVEAVKRLRVKNGGGTAINAGTNKKVLVPANEDSMTVTDKSGGTATVTIVGGSNNELALTLPTEASNMGITKGEVAKTMAGHDTSWSAGHKFKRDDKIFIHCK